MDVETSGAIERLGDRITGLELSLRGEFREGHASLRSEFHEDLAALRTELREGHASLRSEFSDGHVSLRSEFHEELAALRTELREGLAEARRHADVLFESLHDDIRMVAEAVAIMSAKFDPRS